MEDNTQVISVTGVVGAPRPVKTRKWAVVQENGFHYTMRTKKAALKGLKIVRQEHSKITAYWWSCHFNKRAARGKPIGNNSN